VASKTKTSTSKSTAVAAQGVTHSPLCLTIRINPVPASRPRVSRWGTYYAKTYKNWMREAGEKLAELGTTSKYQGPVSVRIEHVVARPKTTDRDFPRGDVDNYAKATLDAVTKAGLAWDDDDQVTHLYASKRFASGMEQPHTYIEVLPL
jgi:Holliday junction resolvase RusA-like endonuclease